MAIHHSLNYVEFGAIDVTATKKFYSSVFGWTFTDYGPEYVAFKDAADREGGFALGAPVGSSPLVVLYSSDLEATQARVKVEGGSVTKPIYAFPGGRRFHFTDPNGNGLAVWSE